GDLVDQLAVGNRHFDLVHDAKVVDGGRPSITGHVAAGALPVACPVPAFRHVIAWDAVVPLLPVEASSGVRPPHSSHARGTGMNHDNGKHGSGEPPKAAGATPPPPGGGPPRHHAGAGSRMRESARRVVKEISHPGPGLVHPALIPGVGVEKTTFEFGTNRR